MASWTMAEILALEPQAALVPPLGRTPTWRELTSLEPRLRELEREIKAVDGTAPHFCANALWYGRGGFKERLCQLAGWGAERDDPTLRTSEAYDVAYEHLYRLLPPCRGCFCL